MNHEPLKHDPVEDPGGILWYLTKERALAQHWYFSARQLARNFSKAGRVNQDAADDELWNVCMSGLANKDPEYIPMTRRVWEEFHLTESKELLQKMADDPQT
jgi:hypothetical protein